MGHFPLISTNLKFQWAILSKFNIAISVVNGPFFPLNGSMAHGPTPAITLMIYFAKCVMTNIFNAPNCNRADVPKAIHAVLTLLL